MAARERGQQGIGLQALLRSTDALAEVACPQDAACGMGCAPDDVSAASIAEHMQEILRQREALHASGIMLRAHRGTSLFQGSQ